MKELIAAAGLVIAGYDSVHAEGGYGTLKELRTAQGEPAPAFSLAWEEPSPARVTSGSVVPGCPGIDNIKPDWVEHTDPAGIPARLKEHLASPLVQASPILRLIHRIPYYLGVSRRGALIAQTDLEPGCQVTGTAAYYVIGEEGNPEINFDLVLASPEGEGTLPARLAELRWFDLKDGRRHRWYNLELAAKRGWLTDEYGRPTPDYRPIELFTGGINELY